MYGASSVPGRASSKSPRAASPSMPAAGPGDGRPWPRPTPPPRVSLAEEGVGHEVHGHDEERQSLPEPADGRPRGLPTPLGRPGRPPLEAHRRPRAGDPRRGQGGELPAPAARRAGVSEKTVYEWRRLGREPDAPPCLGLERLLVASERRGLVGVARASAGDAGLGRFEPVGSRLLERRARRGAHRAFAQGGLRVGAPHTRRGEALEGLADRPSVSEREDLGLVGGATAAARALADRAALAVSERDAFRTTADRRRGHATHVALDPPVSKFPSPPSGGLTIGPIRSSKPAGRSSPPLGWFDSIAAPWAEAPAQRPVIGGSHEHTATEPDSPGAPKSPCAATPHDRNDDRTAPQLTGPPPSAGGV